MEGIVPGARMLADVWLEGTRLTLGGKTADDHQRLESAILRGHASSVYLPIIGEIDQFLMARFLAKVAIEILAHRLMHINGWQVELIDNPQLEPLRRFARIGDQPCVWPFHRRRIYGENDLQFDAAGHHQVLHEFTLLYTPSRELYAVLCLFGEEFAINMGGPELDGYLTWLAAKNRMSPLYLHDDLPMPESMTGMA